jgi:hypothetical protein
MYTIDDVLSYCETVKQELIEGRKRDKLDRRNYLIALLYYKFKYNEFKIAALFDIKRTSVTRAKFQTYQFLSINDISFIANVNEFMLKLPYEFPNHKTLNQTKKKSSVLVHLEPKEFKKLKMYAQLREIRVDHAAQKIITKYLKIWEE